MSERQVIMIYITPYFTASVTISRVLLALVPGALFLFNLILFLQEIRSKEISEELVHLLIRVKR